MTYEIQHFTLADGWVNTWSQDGKPETFPTEAAANDALDDFLTEVEASIAVGDMEGGYDRSEFRIQTT